MTMVRAKLNRSDLAFDDITDAEVSTSSGADGLLEVTLVPDVSDEVALLVKIRVISQGEEDEALRRQVAALLDEEPSADRTAALVEALARLALEVP